MCENTTAIQAHPKNFQDGNESVIFYGEKKKVDGSSFAKTFKVVMKVIAKYKIISKQSGKKSLLCQARIIQYSTKSQSKKVLPIFVKYYVKVLIREILDQRLPSGFSQENQFFSSFHSHKCEI